MRAVMVMDRSFAGRERGLISRLEIGLADEGIRLAHAVPVSMVSSESVGLYSVAVGYAERGLALTRRYRASTLLQRLMAALDLADDAPIDIVHALGNTQSQGGDAWGISFELARTAGAGLVLEVWSGHLIGESVSMVQQARAADIPIALLAPDEALAAALRTRLQAKSTSNASIVVSAPWGVHARESTRQLLESQSTPAIALIADEAEPRALQAALEGLSRIESGAAAGASGPPFLLFVGAEDRAARNVWRLSRRLKMLDRLTLVPDMEGQREPVLSMDILIVPGGSGAGVQRTLVLDAFGSGLAVVTGGDALVGPLNDESITLRVTPPTDPTAWAAAIGGLLSNQSRAREVGWAGRSWVRTNRSASAHVAAVLKVYDDLARRASSARDERIVESAA